MIKFMQRSFILRTIFFMFTSFCIVSISLYANASLEVNEMISKKEFQSLVLTTSNLWLLIASILVFIMHLGFACIEIGLTRSKNTAAILFKNIFIIAIGIISYYVIGFNLMYPDFSDAIIPGILAFGGFGIDPTLAVDMSYNENYTYLTDFLFQAMFAATAATIVSGSVAERVHLRSFVIFAIILAAIIYPIVGSWKWGGGFLDELGFHDFAGSTIVHAVGGWAALAFVILLGSRIGKYNKDGITNPIPGHSIPLATIGTFLLWFGWYGFNGGSILSAEPQAMSHVFTVTTLGAVSGILSAGIFSYIILNNLDLSMILNGALCGLVSITGAADILSPNIAILVGVVGGAIGMFSILILDKLHIDDPVGAISVHLVAGTWGTLVSGLFSPKVEVMSQLIGIITIGAFVFSSSLLILFILKKTLGLRVSPEDEMKGLDMIEHGGVEAYGGFEITHT